MFRHLAIAVVVSLLQVVSATSSLDAMVFTFGSNSPLLSGVVNRFYAVKYQNGAATSERKVAVRVGLESVQARWWSVCPVLKDLGVPVKLEKSVAKLHHKVGIIDKKTVILESYNWTLAANDRNDENTLVMSNEQIADVFVKAFDELWDNVLVSPQ